MSSSCAQTQATLTRHQFKGRVGKTSLKNKASCSTSSSSSSASFLFSSSSSRRRGGAVKCFAISKPWDVQKPCKLVLEDGSVWQGKAFGADGTKVGEVVFNTSLSGYEIFSLCCCCCRRLLFTAHQNIVGPSVREWWGGFTSNPKDRPPT